MLILTNLAATMLANNLNNNLRVRGVIYAAVKSRAVPLYPASE